jgi:hypothetical protein
MTLDVKKSNSSNETPNVITVGVEKYGQKKIRGGGNFFLGGGPPPRLCGYVWLLVQEPKAN